MGWLERNSGAVQAISGVITALLAGAALLGVKLQIDASYKVQQEQSAKEIYREFLNISIANPDLSGPDYCALQQGPRQAAYRAYVDYVLYTAEQVTEMDADWADTMADHLEAHRHHLCEEKNPEGYTPEVEALLKKFQAKCTEVPDCPPAAPGSGPAPAAPAPAAPAPVTAAPATAAPETEAAAEPDAEETP